MKLTTTGVALLLLVLSANNLSVNSYTHIWRVGPINCLTCSDLAECTASSGTLHKCDSENEESEGCVAVFDASGQVIQRGCSTDLEQICAATDSSCYECHSHGCNNLKDNSQLITCVECDAQSDDDCVFDYELVTNRRRCNERCITALYPRTRDQGAPLELVRTCVDDLTQDDREQCNEGLLPNCVSCATDSCNTVELGVRSSCQRCTGGNCANPQPQTCRAILDEEQCYIQLDETGQITDLGCRSEFNVTDVAQLISQKRLWLCSSENCNTKDALPQKQTCTLCSSRTDPNCAVAPEQVTSQTDCEHAINTDCYVRLLDDGHTERGCLSGLEDEDYVACLSNSNETRCTSCSGDYCNQELHPADRLSCHICSSSSSGDECEILPAAAANCQLHLLDQQCVTSIDTDGRTQRGCSYSLSCDATDTQHCQHCSGESCNTKNLKRISDGKPGQWGQIVPMSCRICKNAQECAVLENVDSAVCLSESEYCMTVWDESGTVIARGCTNEVEELHGAYCDASPENCHNCNSHDCNNATALSDYVSCIYCDSTRTADCVLNPTAVLNRRQCHGQCMAALRESSNGSGALELVRSCLDDKQAADQDTCIAGEDSKCVACNTADCNTMDLMSDDNLSCYKCSNTDECAEAETAKCTQYSANDKCYVLFDEEIDVVAMGCLSDLSDAFVDENLHQLHICDDGDNCNSFENLPTPNNCLQCDSNSEENCGADPTKITNYEICAQRPHTSCATRLLTDGSTQRNCISNLATADMKACLLGKSNCTVCSGDMCNSAIYPADRRSCYRCNSLTNPNCEVPTNAEISFCPRFRDSQRCSIKLVNDAIYRGCETEFVCDDQDKQHCRICSSDNCNMADLKSVNIGYPGKWVKPPINCYTCEGAACQNNQLGPVVKCEDNDLQNCATVFAENGTVVRRGCSDLIYKDEDLMEHCDKTPTHCKFCKSSGCNNAHQLDNFISCVLCDGSEQDDCVTKVQDVSRSVSCQKSCYTGLYQRTADDNSALELSRGCLDDLSLDGQEACANGELPHCHACDTAQCNTIAVPEERHSCNYCADDNCSTSVAKVCTAYRENDQCYIHVGDLRIESMGCVSDLDSGFLLENRRDLQLCDGVECNDKDALNTAGTACLYCNSTSDADCIEGGGSLAPVCHHYLHPQCIVTIDEAGILTRGCLMDASDELYDDCLSGESETCKICDTNNCNNFVFPEDWHSCLRCDSSQDANCEKSPSAYGSYCPTYVAGDACVTRLDRTRTRRGCQSELACDPTQTDSCRICEDQNCNKADLMGNYVGEPGQWTALPLSCQVCDDETSCASAAPDFKICEGNNNQVCSTVFGDINQVIARGCSDTIDAQHSSYCEDNSDKCFKCKSNNCNDASSISDYIECYFCDAENDASCSQSTPSVDTTRTRQCKGQCMVGMYPRSSAVDSALLPIRSCLDDLDEIDRQLCADGTHENCVACTGALCNTAAIINEPNACYRCSSEEGEDFCEDIVSEQCVAYRPDDQCYIAFDDEGIIDMGCVSDFETPVVAEIVAQKRMLLCTGKECNHPNTIPTPTTCSQCSSSSDTRCATNPNNLLDTIICSVQPYTECVTHIDAAGTTVRGCLFTLEGDAFYNCLTGEDKLCQICSDDRCNGLSVFPADRRKCHQCDSSSDDSCATAPSSSATCPVYAEDDTCVTTQRNGVTYRGCSSSLTCDDANDSRTCRICSSDNCNTINLERLNADGSPGIWQDVPINCLSCSSSAECASGGGTTKTCTNYDNCMTVFDETSVVTQRDCSNVVLAVEATNTYCTEDPDKCPRCNSNDCNVADSLADYVECISCDSSVNGKCVSDIAGVSSTRHCHKQCMSALRPLFGESNDAYATVRSCYDDKEAIDRDACVAGTDADCVACTDAKCNNEELVEKRQSCIICTGDACQDAAGAACPNYRDQDQCFIEFDEQRSIKSLDCLSKYSHEDIYQLQRSKRLLTCEADNCNTLESIPPVQSCALCSSRTDAQCATKPESISSSTSCQVTGLPECYSRVLQDGSTERGCLSSLEDDEFLACYNGTAELCESCRGDACNKIKYPANRSSCHTCNSQSDANCESTPSSLSVCTVYEENDACVTSYLNGVTSRGCASSLSCEENSRTCVKCQGDGCNVVDLASRFDDNFGKWQDLPLKCLTCTGTGCSAPSSQLCKDNNEQDCVSVFNAEGELERRGCADEVEKDFGSYCAANSGSCPSCKSNECNTITSLNQLQECIYCNSFTDAKCIWEPESSTHKKRLCHGDCMTALYGSTNNGLDLIRTCANDKEATDQESCKAGSDDNCASCTGASCNVDNVPSQRLSCYTCNGEDCENPESKICSIYKPDDSCFLMVDEENSIAQLGCLSSFRSQDLESVLQTKRVAVCDGDNCNLPQLQAAVKCAVCDSSEDLSCITSPLIIDSFDTCSQMPHTGCVTKLEQDGSVKRGCLYDLPNEDFSACLLGTSANCTVCNTDGCNRELYPADRLQCFSCSSDDDVNCESYPSYSLGCASLDDTETCQTSLHDNITTRGCSSSLNCDANDHRNCRSCTDSKCNGIDLANRHSDGQHGLFQPLPLKCHTCVGEHCHNSLGPAAVCAHNDEQDCKTVFEEDGLTVRRRGCADDVDDYEDLYCRERPELCFTCKSNECNSAWNINEYISCVYCNSASDVECVTNPENGQFGSRSCQLKCMVALLDGELIRSCLDDKEEYDRSVCTNDGSGTNCTSCENSQCNNFAYPADRMTCHVCTDATCSSTKVESCRRYIAQDQCFAKYNSGKLELMGCLSDHNDTTLEEWHNNNELWQCEGKDCNDLNRLPSIGVCLACDSNKNLPCAQNPAQISTTESCNLPLSDCLTHIDRDGHTIRGCLSSLTAEESAACVADGSCASCAGEKCNVEKFPANRRKCHICNSVADAECIRQPHYEQICPIYANGDRCVTMRGTDDFVQRGCFSELTCDQNDANNCKICDTDGCNTQDMTGAAAHMGAISLSLTLILAFVVSQLQFNQ